MARPVPYSDHRDQRPQGDEERCLLCRRPMKGRPPRWVEVFDGGATMAEPGEHPDPNDPGYMGWWPVGPECRKKVGNCAQPFPGRES